MKRIQYHEYGGPEVLRLEEFEPAPVGVDDVRVRVHAASVNPMDFGIRSGGMKIVTGRKFPRAMGYDFAGVVEAVGDRVSRIRVGDEVLGAAPMRSAGAFADVVITGEKWVVIKPSDLSFEAAATLPTPGVTAFQALVTKGGLQSGQSVFIHSCLGAVGRSAAQIALARHASVGGSCRPSAADEARELGIDPVVDFDVSPTSLRQRFDLVLDTAGNLPIGVARALINPGGRLISVHPTPMSLARGFFPGPYRTVIGQPVTRDLEELSLAASKGTLSLPIAQTVPLSEALPALTDLENNRLGRRGKLIITPN